MLDDGNKYAANKFKSQHGLKQVASAFGIIGEQRSVCVWMYVLHLIWTPEMRTPQ